MDSQSSCVVVTGFGPFRQHLVNSSWEAVKETTALMTRTEISIPADEKANPSPASVSSATHVPSALVPAVHELSQLGLGSDVEVELQTLQLPVDYREVKQRVARIWEDLQPQFVVHVGVDPAAKAIFLEQCSKNRGYRDADIRGFRPEGGVCLPGGPEVVTSEVSMKAVSRRAAVEGVEVAFFPRRGYVCDYAYYLSLHQGNGCAALIHVPPLSPWLPASLLGKSPASHHPGNAGGD